MSVRLGFFDINGRLLRELDEAELSAIAAVGGQVAKQHTCMVAKDGGKPMLLGSGTLVQVGDRTFVATAKHLFKDIRDDELIALYWSEDDQRDGTYRKTITYDEKLDLAVVPMSAEIPPCGVSMENLDLDCPCGQNSLFVVSGVPGEKFSTDDAARTVIVGHWSAGLAGLPEKAWPRDIEGRPPSSEVDVLMNYTERFALDANGEPMRQVDPHGLSGGGIWSVPAQAQGVWSSTEAKLVAVQWAVERDKWRFLYATRIKHWLRLLASTFPETRQHIRQVCPDVETKTP